MRTPMWSEDWYREFLELRDIIMILGQEAHPRAVIVTVDPICAGLMPRYRFLKKMVEGKVI